MLNTLPYWSLTLNVPFFTLCPVLYSWAQLFKTNDVVSQHIVKTLIIKYGIYDNIFAEKNTCELDIVPTITVNILTTNELVKLTML